MNLIRMHQCRNVNYLSQEKESIDNTTFTRTIYQVDATKICQLIKRNEKECLYKSFGQLLYRASIDRQEKKSIHQEDNYVSDFISVAIHWNPSQCTTSNVEDFVSIIDPFICLRELFSNVTISDSTRLNLIGLICFYGSTIEVFFSYNYSTSQWLFCFDGHKTIINDWIAVKRKCLDFHLQPFLLIYGNSQENSVDINQLLKRTVIQAKIMPSERKSDSSKIQEKQNQLNKIELKRDLYSLENLSKISSFATLNSSMLFMPQSSLSSTTNSYINQKTVVKVMQQQLLKKELLSDTISPFVHIRQRYDETLSSENSSTSSQRDSGLSSGINDGSSDDSLPDYEQTEYLMNHNHLNISLASIEYYLEQSLKYESSSNYSAALESCQQALVIVNQIFNLIDKSNTDLFLYARTRKNSLLLRIRTLKTRQIQYEELNSSFKLTKNFEKKNKNLTTITSILSSTTRLVSRPKKNVKFSDNIALIVPTSDDIHQPSNEHLIHSFLRKIHQQPTTTSDSDLDIPSSSDDIRIGLIECSLCHKRFSKTNQTGIYCSNCHFYMQRFQPTTTT